MFSHFFIDRPILSSVPSIIITLVGLVAVFTLPVAQYPEITPPTVRVNCIYPVRSAQVVADTVAAPIEQQVNGVEDMLFMSSQCSNDGTYSLTVTFKVGTNLNMAQVLVQNRVALAMPTLPDVVKQIGVTTKKRSPDLMLIVNLFSPDGRYDQLYLSNYTMIQIVDELARLDGVGDVFILGQRDYSMRIWLDPDRLTSRSITAGDVVRALQEQNVQVAAGQIGQQPAAKGSEFPIHFEHVGPAHRTRAIRRHHHQDRQPRRDYPLARRGAHRSGGQEPGHQQLFRRQALGRRGRVPIARRKRPGNRPKRERQNEGARKALSRRSWTTA